MSNASKKLLFGEVIDVEAGGMCQKLDFVIEEVLLKFVLIFAAVA
jgi:hypothetical protein